MATKYLKKNITFAYELQGQPVGHDRHSSLAKRYVQ
jgi:hypothetical protein